MGQARTLPFSQHPLFWRYTHYQRALLSQRSRVKCPLPDIMLACPAKRAQRCFMSDSLQKAAMDSFVSRKNIKRYRRLAGESTGSIERLRIMKLLAEEESKFIPDVSRQGGAPEGRSPVNGATANPVGHDGAGPRSGS
jgi:hypothetical protein